MSEITTKDYSMSPLPLRVDACPDEHAISLASRLAVVNCVSLEEFLLDFSISVRDLIDGQPDAVARVAQLAGVEEAPYLAATPQYDRRRVRIFAGHEFPAAALHGPVLRGCPLCLAADDTPYLRGKWALNALTVCTEHGVPLWPLWRDMNPLRKWDVAAKTNDLTCFLEDAPSAAEAPSSLGSMLWIEARLGGQVEADSWLDGLPLSVGIGLCEALGADLSAVSRDTELPAFEVGYRLCRQGPAAIMRKMEALRTAAALGESPTNFMPKLQLWLKGAFHKPDLRPLRNSLADMLRQVWGASPGQEVLSEPVLCRETYSLKELARLSRQPIETLRQKFALRETSPVPKGLAEPFLETLPALTEDRCCEIFCADPSMLNALRSAHPAEPFCGDAGWNILPVQRAVDHLLLGAEPVGKTGWGWRALPQAAVELNCSLPELIERLCTHEGTLRVGRLSGRFGFGAIGVNTRGRGHCEISAETFAEWQGVEPSEMLSLFRRGASPSRITKRAKGRKDQILLTPQHIEDFHAQFISFRSLALRLRKSWDDADKLLIQNKITPAEGCRQIYELSPLRKLLAETG